MLYFITGLLILLGAVGGIEASVTNIALIQCILLAFPGVGLMLAGVNQLQNG